MKFYRNNYFILRVLIFLTAPEQAEEEFNIEKQRIVQEEKGKIGSVYERKYKQIEIKKKMFVKSYKCCGQDCAPDL